MSHSWVRSMMSALRALGPYVLIELVLPGGTLVALLLWLAQHKKTALSGLTGEARLQAPVRAVPD